MDESYNYQSPPQANNRGKWLSIILAIALVGALVAVAVLGTKLTAAGNEGRTISVTGEASLKETPDEYVFYPSYTFRNADKAVALAEMTKKSDEVVAGLKKAGVADKAVKVNSNGYDSPVLYDRETKEASYNLQLTVTVGNKELAQKVQDYLVTTSPSGAVSPTANFSDAKRKELESKARDDATKEARSKADQTAKNLGFKVGKVRSVSDGAGFGGIMAAEGRATIAPSMPDDAMSNTKLGVQPGENELNYSVTVVYEIR